jgi:hypothetical protein
VEAVTTVASNLEWGGRRRPRRDTPNARRQAGGAWREFMAALQLRSLGAAPLSSWPYFGRVGRRRQFGRSFEADVRRSSVEELTVAVELGPRNIFRGCNCPRLLDRICGSVPQWQHRPHLINTKTFHKSSSAIFTGTGLSVGTTSTFCLPHSPEAT